MEEMGKYAGFTKLKLPRKIVSAHSKLPIIPMYKQL